MHVWKILLDLRSFTKFISYHVLDLGSLKARDSASLQFRFYPPGITYIVQVTTSQVLVKFSDIYRRVMKCPLALLTFDFTILLT